HVTCRHNGWLIPGKDQIAYADVACVGLFRAADHFAVRRIIGYVVARSIGSAARTARGTRPVVVIPHTGRRAVQQLTPLIIGWYVYVKRRKLTSRRQDYRADESHKDKVHAQRPG